MSDVPRRLSSILVVTVLPLCAGCGTQEPTAPADQGKASVRPVGSSVATTASWDPGVNRTEAPARDEQSAVNEGGEFGPLRARAGAGGGSGSANAVIAEMSARWESPARGRAEISRLGWTAEGDSSGAYAAAVLAYDFRWRGPPGCLRVRYEATAEEGAATDSSALVVSVGASVAALPPSGAGTLAVPIEEGGLQHLVIAGQRGPTPDISGGDGRLNASLFWEVRGGTCGDTGYEEDRDG